MMARSGANTAMVSWAYAAPHVAPDWRAVVLGFGLSALTSLGPDIDHAGSTISKVFGRSASKLAKKAGNGHRGGWHSGPMILGMAALAYWLLYGSEWCAWAAGIGWASHIFTDLLTKQGVAFFWPLGVLGALWKPLRVLNRKVRIAWFTTGSRAEVVYNVLVLCLGGYLAVQYANSLILQIDLPGGTA